MGILSKEDQLVKQSNSQATRVSKRVIKDQPTTIHELFAGWKDDGVRDQELDWGGCAQVKELAW